MVDRRRIVTLGAAGAVLAVQLMQPSGFISTFLLLASLFLVAWGIVPDVIQRWAARTGPIAPYLLHALGRLDDLLGRIVGSSSEKAERLNRLADQLTEGGRLLNRRVTSDDELSTWKRDYDNWTNNVSAEIEEHFGRPQALTFRSVVSVLAADMPPAFNGWHNNKKLRLNKRIDNLRSFINANSNHQA